jgi:hypothetical protein
MDDNHSLQQPAKQTSNALLGLLDIGQRLVVLVAYITILGFIVSFSILYRTTTFLSFAVYPQQYLFWGAVLVAFAVIPVVVVIVCVFGLISFLMALFFVKGESKRFQFKHSFEIALGALKTLLYSNKAIWMVVALAITLIAFKPELVLPDVSSNPPKSITLIFKDDIDPALWHLSVTPSQPRSAQALILLEEYTDGLLVKDEKTGAVVKVENDMIAGIVDNTSLSSAATPALSPVAPTASPTP